MASNAETSAAAPVGRRSLISANDVRGKIVNGRDGDKLGTVDKLILDERTGQVAYVILSTGGFLGLGQSYHPIPWSALRHDEKHGGYVAAIDKRLLGFEPVTVDWAIEHHRRDHGGYSQPSYQRGGLAMAVREAHAPPLAFRAAAMAAGHVGGSQNRR